MRMKPRFFLGMAVLTGILVVACAGGPAATPSPPPTPTTVPTITSTTALETKAVTTENLTASASGFLTQLAEGLGPRASTTEEERKAAEYLADQFASFGYAVESQPFSVERLSPEDSGLTVSVDNPDIEKVEVLPLSGSSFGEASGVLTPVGLGMLEEIPSEGLEGRIALVERGVITFQRKARNARDAGAVGVVIYNNGGANFEGDLGQSTDIPVVSVSWSDGQRLEEVASQGGINATISLNVVDAPSQNIIAEKPGTSGRVVVIGAHYDTIPNVAGANDNASGTATILTIAQVLSEKTLPFTVRFIAFGSEELGLLGSRAYVESLSDEEGAQIIAMLNFDALGSGTSLGVLGDPELTEIVAGQGKLQGIAVVVSQGLRGGSSDHASFAQVGIPVAMFFADDASRIHTPQDTLEFVDPGLAGGAAKLGLDLLDALAGSV